MKYTMIGALAGAFLYCMYIVVKYLMDDTIHTADDMEKYFDIVPLAVIPDISQIESESRERNLNIARKESNCAMKKLNLTIKDVPYAAEEALNRLRVNIKFCGKKYKRLLLQAVFQMKVRVAFPYVWKLLAEAGFPTVLVDDLRKSELKTNIE